MFAAAAADPKGTYSAQVTSCAAIARLRCCCRPPCAAAAATARLPAISLDEVHIRVAEADLFELTAWAVFLLLALHAGSLT